MAAKNFDEWCKSYGLILPEQKYGYRACWRAAIKFVEAQPTVRSKRPVQQRKGKTVRPCSEHVGCKYYQWKCDYGRKGCLKRTASPVA